MVGAVARYGAQYGPDITFLGVPRCDWADAATYAGADVVILGAPFDGGTSHRPGTRFGPQYIRQACYLPHDGSRPSLALRVDALTDLAVYDAGDVEMFSGDAERSVRDLQHAVHTVTASGAIPLVLGGDHTIAWPDAAGVAQHLGQGRISMIHFDAHADTGDVNVRLAGRARPADAPADRVGRGARRPVPAARAARLLAGAGDPGLDGRPADALLRDDRDRRARPDRSASPRRSPSPPTTATACSCPSTSTSATPATRPAPARPNRAG